MQWKLIRLRKENGLTQRELADLLGINTGTYISKEKGKSTFKANEMFALRNFFNKPIEEIFLPSYCIDDADMR